MSKLRLARLVAPETWHQVTGRGIESRKVFKTKENGEDFLDRLAEVPTGYLKNCRNNSLYGGNRPIV